jgi:hypothetical protein
MRADDPRAAADLGAHWAELVSVALLGTDRRDPPDPPAGPLAELALEHPGVDAAGALVQQVAALTVLRRAAALPAPPPPLLVRPTDDPRPCNPPAAADLLRRVIADWPALEAEWLALAAAGGWRLSPDLVPLLLARHRARPETRPAVEHLAGPVAAWLADLVPGLAAAPRRSSAAGTVVELPGELEQVVDADASAVVAVVADGLRRQRYTSPSRSVLVHLVARVRPSELDGIRHRLEHLDPQMAGIGLAYHLADLAATRLAIHRHLTPETS